MEENKRSIPNIDDTLTEDGILLKIISSMSLRQAVKTSILSPRWRNIWTHLPKLKFAAANILDAPARRVLVSRHSTEKEKFELEKGNRDCFIRLVDSILQHHQGAGVEELEFRYYLTKIHSRHLDEWVDFALKSKTKRLTLNLFKPHYIELENDPETEMYDFPYQLLGPSSSLKELTLASCYLKPPCKFDGLSHLRKLYLFHVDIMEEDINHLLSNCYTLNFLSVCNAPRLVKLSIPQTLSQLQHLCVKCCIQLGEINIKATNLCQLRYWGSPVELICKQSSQLRDAKFLYDTKVGEPNLNFYLDKLSRTLPHLRSLVLHIGGASKVVSLPQGHNRFIHLKCLDWTWGASDKMSLPCLSALLDLAPFLGELKLRFWTNLQEDKFHQKRLFWSRVQEPPPQSLEELRNMIPEHPCTRMKTVEIHMFCWDKWQIEIALYLVKNAINLELMTLHNGFDSFKEIPQIHKKNLSQEVPANVKLVIL